MTRKPVKSCQNQLSVIELQKLCHEQATHGIDRNVTEGGAFSAPGRQLQVLWADSRCVVLWCDPVCDAGGCLPF
jgi:hypothetical protein